MRRRIFFWPRAVRAAAEEDDEVAVGFAVVEDIFGEWWSSDGREGMVMVFFDFVFSAELWCSCRCDICN